jgi:hypothetical protein
LSGKLQPGREPRRRPTGKDATNLIASKDQVSRAVADRTAVTAAAGQRAALPALTIMQQQGKP